MGGRRHNLGKISILENIVHHKKKGLSKEILHTKRMIDLAIESDSYFLI